MDKTEFNILKNNTMTLSVQVKPMKIKVDDLVWTSSDESVAVVNEKGVVTGVSKGTATITVSSSKYERTAQMTVNVTELPEGESIEIENLNNDNEYISKIEPGMTIEEFKNNISLTDNLVMEITDEESNIVEVTEKIATNYNIVIKNKATNEVIQEYKSVIYGDADGDGEITSRDLYKIQRHILRKSRLTPVGSKAANLNKNGAEPSSRDLYKIQRHILKKSVIEQ